MSDNLSLVILIVGPFALLFMTIYMLAREKPTMPLRCRVFGHTAFRSILFVGSYGPYDHCGRCGHPLPK